MQLILATKGPNLTEFLSAFGKRKVIYFGEGHSLLELLEDGSVPHDASLITR